MWPNYRRSLTGSQQVPLLPSSENDAWEINNKSIPVTQQLQGSNHWETLELYLVCLYLNGLLLLLFSKLGISIPGVLCWTIFPPFLFVRLDLTWCCLQSHTSAVNISYIIMFITMDLMSYGSVFKYESNNTKSVWYHLQILPTCLGLKG